MNKTVLICDDEPYILESVKHVVQKEGYRVVTAEDGNRSLELARKEKPDLIILDVMMPGITGYEVCKILKDNEETKDIFIVLLTARGQEVDRVMGLEAGVNEYISKPFSPRKLRTIINKILN
ncbi:MAG: response regulator [Desulfobacteraceae bacterium]|nr:response regulator [Desulfobacteraceae bacterium]